MQEGAHKKSNSVGVVHLRIFSENNINNWTDVRTSDNIKLKL